MWTELNWSCVLELPMHFLIYWISILKPYTVRSTFTVNSRVAACVVYATTVPPIPLQRCWHSHLGAFSTRVLTSWCIKLCWTTLSCHDLNHTWESVIEMRMRPSRVSTESFKGRLPLPFTGLFLTLASVCLLQCIHYRLTTLLVSF